MSITSSEQFEKLRACGMIVGKALQAMAGKVRPGVTTAELSEIGARVLAVHGARSSPPMVYGFPGDVCISVNDEVVHGIPSDRAIQPGDLVKLDLTAEKDGYHTDSAVSIEVPPSRGKTRELAHCAERAFRQALAARIGRNREIGGFHYASDTQAGRDLADAIFDMIETDRLSAAPVVPGYADTVQAAGGEWL